MATDSQNPSPQTVQITAVAPPLPATLNDPQPADGPADPGHLHTDTVLEAILENSRRQTVLLEMILEAVTEIPGQPNVEPEEPEQGIDGHGAPSENAVQ